MAAILSIYDELTRGAVSPWLPITILISEASVRGIPEEDARRIIEALIAQGMMIRRRRLVRRTPAQLLQAS